MRNRIATFYILPANEATIGFRLVVAIAAVLTGRVRFRSMNARGAAIAIMVRTPRQRQYEQTAIAMLPWLSGSWLASGDR